MRIFLVLILVLLIGCNTPVEKKENLGEVRIEVTGKADAKPHFERGLLLLHSFEYEDARHAFQQAKKQDPEMPMAYWGEAMTYNHSLWSEQDFEKASEVLTELKAFDYRNKATDLERDLIEAVFLLYQPKKDKPERDVAYAEYMQKLSEKYPNNHEVAAFYALSLLGSVPEGRDEQIYGMGAEIAQGILEENPNHPGALHYLIHSYDDPDHAMLALDAAHAYAKVAPDASHALHMPSHIFVAMGMWDKVIASNIDSYEASVQRMNTKNLDNDARGYHAYHWLEYGYLQKNQVEEAEKMVREMQQFARETPSKRARVHLVFLKGTYLVDTNAWGSDISEIAVDISDLNISVRSQYHFLEGMKAYVAKDKTTLDSLIKLADKEHRRGSFVVEEGASKLCSNVDRGKITSSDLTEVLVRKHQMQALMADLNNNPTLAEQHFLQSIELEELLSYSYGPPQIQKPTHELYADWLLKEGRYQESLAQYEYMLKRAPKRRLATEGIENAQGYL